MAGRRRRRSSSATRVSLFTAGRNAVGKTAAGAVKILMKRIGERGSNLCDNYYFKHWIALESSSDVCRETFRDTQPLKNPPITRRTITNRKFLGEAMGRNGMKETMAPMKTGSKRGATRQYYDAESWRNADARLRRRLPPKR